MKERDKERGRESSLWVSAGGLGCKMGALGYVAGQGKQEKQKACRHSNISTQIVTLCGTEVWGKGGF